MKLLSFLLIFLSAIMASKLISMLCQAAPMVMDTINGMDWHGWLAFTGAMILLAIMLYHIGQRRQAVIRIKPSDIRYIR